MQLYERIKFIRLFKGWSPEETAARLCVSVNGYAKIERGESDITLSRLEQIAEIFGIDPSELFGLSEKNIFHFVESHVTNHHQIAASYVSLATEQTETKNELEKALLIIQQQEKEIGYLKEEIVQLKEIIDLLKKSA